MSVRAPDGWAVAAVGASPEKVRGRRHENDREDTAATTDQELSLIFSRSTGVSPVNTHGQDGRGTRERERMKPSF